LDQILKTSKDRGVKIKLYDTRRDYPFISKNSKQDQGVALDIYMDNFLSVDEFIKNYSGGYRVIALDGINNPQNLGMDYSLCYCWIYRCHSYLNIKKASNKRYHPLAYKRPNLRDQFLKFPIIKE